MKRRLRKDSLGWKRCAEVESYVPSESARMNNLYEDLECLFHRGLGFGGP